MQKKIQEYIISSENELDEIDFHFIDGDRIFFYGDLGSGKSTFIRHLLRKYSINPSLVVRSPTYTYYQKYQIHKLNIFHCDLYRIDDYSTWVSIGGDELVQDMNNIFLIEWPEILGESISPTKKVYIEILENEQRKITIEDF